MKRSNSGKSLLNNFMKMNIPNSKILGFHISNCKEAEALE